jgi:hypothetical protein
MTLANQDSPVLNELKKISKILLLTNSTQVEKELAKIVNTNARKKMWIFIDGKRMPKDIAQKVGVSQMAISKFLDYASAADLVVYAQREPPRRILDYVPPSWVDLVITEEKEELEKQEKDQPNEQKGKTKQIELSDNISGVKKE